VDGPVRQKLDFLAGELTKAADKELQVDYLTLLSPAWLELDYDGLIQK
jgi:hypothetical protein